MCTANITNIKTRGSVMLHTVEALINKINVMHTKAIYLHRLRNQFSEHAEQTYDHIECQAIIDDIQAMALLIAKDTQGTEIKTEMEYKKFLKDDK